MDDAQNGGLISRLSNWASHPFRSDMGVLGWALFLGLILILVFLWSRVLNHVVAEA